MTTRNENFSEFEEEEPGVVEKAARRIEQVEKQRRPWLVSLLVGTILGVAIATVGIRVFSNQPSSESLAKGNKSSQKVISAMTVTLATVETTRVARILNATGTVQASNLTPVLPQANGLLIKKILVNVGASVKAGQIMAVLDDSLLQDQIRQAKADVASKQADVAAKQADLASKQGSVASSQATVSSNQAIVQQRQADLAQARAKLKDAETNLRRNRQLVDQGAISRQQSDTAETSQATALSAIHQSEANIRSAEANVKSAQASVSSAIAAVQSAQASVSSAMAAVQSYQAKVQQLKTQLGQTAVRAPVSGIVAEKLARIGDITGVAPQTQVGTIVGGTQKLFSIIQDQELQLQALVPEIQLPDVQIGTTVQITSDANERLSLQGRVSEIEPIVNQQRREATVKIDIPPTSLLKPGMFARAAIAIGSVTGVAVPQKAVLPQADGSAIVFVLRSADSVRAQKVEVGESIIARRVEIKSGLKVGDRVVVDGAGYLHDGDKVQIAPTTELN
ncbi:MAG: efflux RND transporter periplasmic adaptor subunit [Rhizonema sp. PD37]|nr:efflux RND transporter periplasmic adaptor subunit [Rhizonema sp. PD37]